ncbi:MULTISPECIES: Wzz/FepE/Etk N-terminal domain-containing protein [Lacrimispora]|uniref:YveK family protein n=1 Tax=Lacrimispora TaxID=2719231 RepID=UPI000BE3EA60|nr:Wzz/FepE/Etk N-terminal domain-containing protein [Lacrimispora amygdalina]MDK2967462.1 protein tyrosine kinase modulator [Lacrimispora sp.]
MRTNNMDDNQEIQIDLLELFYKLKGKLWLILLITFISGVGAGAYSRYVLTPQYTSTAMLYVLSKESSMTSLADLQVGTQLTKDYKIMITSRPVMEKVVNSLGLDMSYKDLKKKISVTNPTDTRILTLAVQDTDPEQAKKIVDEIAMAASDYIGDMMEMVQPKIFEEGEVPSVKTGPDNKKNAMIGAAAGMFFVLALLTAGVLIDDTIRTEEDAERYLGLTVLAVVPNREGSADKKTKKFWKKGISKHEKFSKPGKSKERKL